MNLSILRQLPQRAFHPHTKTSIPLHFRYLSTKPTNSNLEQSNLDNPVIYNNPRRGQSAAMTVLAIGQAGFWASAAALGQSVPDPILSPGWTVAGFGLSAAFFAMINAYLRRNIAQISLIDGPSLEVITHSLGGRLRSPVLIKAADIIPGPHRDKTSERYWTFGVKRGEHRSSYYYIIDRHQGVIDSEAVAALARGGDHLMVYAHKRDAGRMQTRWKQWRHAKQA